MIFFGSSPIRTRVQAILLAYFVFPASDAGAWYCGTSIVAEDDLKTEVLDVCGKPDARFSQKVPFELEVGQVHTRRRYQNTDYWVFLNGPTEFARILYFEEGVLEDIRAGDYGGSYDRDPAQCQTGHTRIDLNQTKPELELRCGPPDEQITVEEFTRAIVLGEGHRVFKTIVVDEWLYHDDDELWVYRFHNGVLKWKGERDAENYRPLR